MESLNRMVAEAMKALQNAIVRLAELPGLGIDSAQQIIAEIGPRECGRVQQRSLSQTQSFDAPAAQSTRARCSQEGRLSASNRFPPLGFPPRVRKSGLGHRPPPLPADLENPSRRCDLYGIWTDTHAPRAKAETATASDPTQETRIRSPAYPDCARLDRRLIFEGVAGGGGGPAPLCPAKGGKVPFTSGVV